MLRADNEQPPTVAQINTLRADMDEVKVSLEKQGVQAAAHPWLDNCLTLTGTGDLEKLDAFRFGLIYIQDAAARLAVEAAAPQSGSRVLDCCAAPGGKSFAAAIAMKNRGEVLSCDIHPHKIGLIEAGRDRLGLTCITAREQNARNCVKDWEAAFDLVLADVPCSGLGIIRKKPDIRFKDPEQLDGLPTVQQSILDNISQYVCPGGILLYSTCTLRRKENEDTVHKFLAAHPDYALEAFVLPGPAGACKTGMVTLWPQIHGTDGFFIAKLRRQI